MVLARGPDPRGHLGGRAGDALRRHREAGFGEQPARQRLVVAPAHGDRGRPGVADVAVESGRRQRGVDRRWGRHVDRRTARLPAGTGTSSSGTHPGRRCLRSRRAGTTDVPLDGYAEVIVGKQRNGPTGTAKLAFVKQFTRFENLEWRS